MIKPAFLFHALIFILWLITVEICVGKYCNGNYFEQRNSTYEKKSKNYKGNRLKCIIHSKLYRFIDVDAEDGKNCSNCARSISGNTHWYYIFIINITHD